MIDLSDERLFALQQEYDELEAALLERLPEFRLYLASRDHDDRQWHERHFSTNANFQRWQALEEVIELHSCGLLFITHLRESDR